jgi:hypothetical protein
VHSCLPTRLSTLHTYLNFLRQWVVCPHLSDCSPLILFLAHDFIVEMMLIKSPCFTSTTGRIYNRYPLTRDAANSSKTKDPNRESSYVCLGQLGKLIMNFIFPWRNAPIHTFCIINVFSGAESTASRRNVPNFYKFSLEKYQKMLAHKALIPFQGRDFTILPYFPFIPTW